jgi:Spherulation-specific family 4
MKLSRSFPALVAATLLSGALLGITASPAARLTTSLDPVAGSVIEVANTGGDRVVSTMPLTIADNYWAPLSTRYGFAKFSTGISSSIPTDDLQRAVLRVGIQNCDAPYSPGGAYSIPVRVAATTSTNWSQPTWATLPQVEDEQSRRPNGARTLEYDVTDEVENAGTTVGFRLRMASGTGRPRFQPNYCNISSLKLVLTTNVTTTTTAPTTIAPTTTVPTTIAPTTAAPTTTASTSVPGNTHSPIGLAAPAYIYKGIQADYDKLIAAGLKIVVLNPNSGPSVALEPEYATHIQRFTAAGTKVFGYVRTNYGTQPIATVQAEVQRWIDLYGPSGLAGIFFDESTSDCTGANNYYETIIASAHNKGLQTILNPGVVPSTGCLASSTDIMVTWENNDALAQPTFLDSTTVKWKQWHIVYNVATCARMSALATQARANKVDYFWATDDPGPAAGNPFDTVPTFLSPMNSIYTTGAGVC